VNNEELLYQLARGYAEREGAQLRKELKVENAPTPGLDKKLRRGLFRLKYKIHVRVAGMAAACLALALLLPLILQQTGPGVLAPTPQIAAPAPAAGEFAETEEFGALAAARGGALADDYIGIAPTNEPLVGFDAQIGDQLPPELTLPPPVGYGEYVTPFAVTGGLDGELGGEGVGWAEGYSGLFLEPAPPLNFELPEGFYLDFSMYGHEEFLPSYTLLHGQNGVISFGVGHLENLDAEHLSIFEDGTLAQMQLGSHVVHYTFTMERLPLVLFAKEGMFYQISGCPNTTLEDILVLIEAIIAG